MSIEGASMTLPWKHCYHFPALSCHYYSVCLFCGNCVDKKIRGLQSSEHVLMELRGTQLLGMSQALNHLHRKQCECIQNSKRELP